MPEERTFPAVMTRHLHKGDCVRFTQSGLGIISLIWYGCEEMVDVLTLDGIVHLCPDCGDRIKVIAKAPAGG